MTNVALDTHVLLWALLEPQKLSPTLRNALEDTEHPGCRGWHHGRWRWPGWSWVEAEQEAAGHGAGCSRRRPEAVRGGRAPDAKGWMGISARMGPGKPAAMAAPRIDEQLLEQLDAQGANRSALVSEALTMWLARRPWLSEVASTAGPAIAVSETANPGRCW